nr:SDR family NAD(P)-dependent oxidoreductase [Acidimicrobiia bacterium]
MDLIGTNALVTGGAVRVGRSIASTLAAEGANVYIHYNRSSGPAEELAAELQSAGVRVDVGSANLSDPESATGLIEQATEALGPISVLVNSASGFPEDTITDVTLDQLRTTHDLTLASPLLLTQAFAEALPD